MADYNSKYTGEEVEQLLDQVANGEVGGETLTEADIANMGFTKNVGTITEVKMNGVSKGTSGVVDLGTVITDISGKQDVITDLATIREGAAKGATAVQPSDIPEETYLVGFTMDSLRQGMNNGGLVRCNMNSLIEAMAANKTILVREDEASDGFKGVYVLNGYAEDLLYFSIVDSQGDVLYCEGTDYSYSDSIDGRTLRVRRWDDKVDSEVLSAVATSGSYNDLSDRPTIPSAITESTVSGWGFTKNTGTYSKPSGGIPKSDLASDVQSALGKAESAVQRDKYGDMDSIQTHGFEGSLSGKLYALPDEATGDEDETLLSTHNVKTINGQSIFGKGNISIEGGGSGTITEVKANGTSIATSGVANIPAASTSAYGVTKLSSSTSSTSTTLAATASAVKAAYDLANSKASMSDVNTTIANAITNAINASY